MTKKEAINQVNTSFPSIWSREDVINLIDKINESTEIDTFSLVYQIRAELKSAINEMLTDDILDKNNIVFEIRHGNEIKIDGISIDTSNFLDIVMTVIESAIDDYIDDKEEASVITSQI